MVDLDRRIVIDMVEGNAARDLKRLCAIQDIERLKGIAARDPHRPP